MIHNRAAREAVKLPTVRGSVYRPQAGWSYAHHPHIAAFRGRLVAIWSNGRVNEDDLGQRVLLAESADGETWERVRPLVTPEMLGNPKKVVTAAGFHVDGEILYVYYGVYRYDPAAQPDENARPIADAHHLDTELGYVSTTDLIHWSEPRSLGLRMIPNHGPQRTRSGRLILSGNVLFPYTDDPSGVAGYHLAGIYGDAFGEAEPVDDSESIHRVTRHFGWNAGLICEGSFYQTDDGVLHMLLRSNTERLWHSESRDDGVTWSEPAPTDYSDDSSKFHTGRLPDGRFYCVSNAKTGSGRRPLDLYLSEDGESFDRHIVLRDEPYAMQFEGLYKGGQYGYPHSLVHDGALYVIYSKQKEAIEVTKLDLRRLSELP